MSDLDQLRDHIESLVAPLRCTDPGNPAPGITHCAGCCMQTGYVATFDEELELARALDAALVAIDNYRDTDTVSGG